MIVQCKQCGIEFEAKSHLKLYCSKCLVEREREQKRKRHTRVYTNVKAECVRITSSQTIEEIDRERVAYNKKHGTRLSYGKYVALRRMDKLKGD